ncbi:uncharacterized protein MONBRDRAFT_4959 [Monosiga brevicollis MX1]|uniref:DDE-1 domain-containing protein n=1 Tax=Monosiga brevicollis TaxID=81824 RepID=A9UPG8_MONBE|nr:uncharacterized protein MONBRDRAFT_4959 [Monosiga brevicollis MX1]EDQ92420.1 predicted protein [Monosiga brevicollis MX1]|eukprot:XP_001742182.1 hypothetical protein [Monosiga brevicollis MX1]
MAAQLSSRIAGGPMRQHKAQQRTQATHALEMYELVRHGTATENDVRNKAHADGLGRISRSQIKILCPNRPTHVKMGHVTALYGVTRCDIVAARGRRRRGDVMHDGRQLCTQAERGILASWMSTMSDLHSHRTRRQATLAVCEILQVRERALQDQTRLQPAIAGSIAPLSAPERKLLQQKEAYDASPAEAPHPTISKQWFRALEKDFDLQLISAQAQTEAKALALTPETCEAYFTCLEDVLSRLDFVHQTGRDVGCIKSSGLSRIWSVGEIPSLRTGLGMTQVHASMAHREGVDVFRGHTHNESVTAVLGICMDGDMAPPMMIHAQPTLGPQVIAPTNGPTAAASDASFAHFLNCSTHSGNVNRRIFVAFCRRLRAYVGDCEPLLLLSHGHPTCIDVDVVAYLRTINIFLFVLPPNTSHGLAPLDQWHCYIHQKWRDLCLHSTGVVSGHAPTLDEEIQALYRAINAERECPSRIQSAFCHAGITKASRGTEHMSSRPRLSRAHSASPRRSVTAERSRAPLQTGQASQEIDEAMPRTPTPPSSAGSDSTPFSSSMSTPRKIVKAHSLNKTCERLKAVASRLQQALDSRRVALTDLQVDLSPSLQRATAPGPARRAAASSAVMARMPPSEAGVSQAIEDTPMAPPSTSTATHLPARLEECASNDYHLVHNAPADFAFWLRPVPANTFHASRDEQDQNPTAMEMIQLDTAEMQQIIEHLDDGCRQHRDHMTALKRSHT